MLKKKLDARTWIFLCKLPALAAVSCLGLSLLAGCVANKIPVKIPGEGVAIYAAGDIADCRYRYPADAGAAQTAALIARELDKDDKAIVVTLGDNTYPIGAPAEFSGCYEPTWGRFKSRTYPAAGNHDYYTKEGAGYYAYFGERAKPGQHGYYSFQIGKWQVIALNSALHGNEFAMQLDWLKSELSQHTGPCTLAYWHHPVFSSGGHGNNDFMLPVWKLLAASGADVALAAHDHDYERFAPQDGNGRRDEIRGVRQFVVGTGGADLTPVRFGKPNSEVKNNSTHGVLKLTLKEGGYEWEFMPATPGGFTDRGAARCH